MEPLVFLVAAAILALIPVALIRHAHYSKPESARRYKWFNLTVTAMWAGSLILAGMGLALGF